MANRKVFLSILGTGFYGEGIYVNAEAAFESLPTRFIQDATLQYLTQAEEKWTKEDAIIIVLTEHARKQNWIPADNKRFNNQSKQDETYVGLKEKLAQLNLPVTPTELSIPDGKDESEMWQIFTSIYEQLQQGDELYIDLTHSFRYIPMLLLVLADYARFLKNVTVKSLTYGNWEARDTVSNRAPIVNLMSLIALQNWTSAVSEFVKNGNADAVCQTIDEKFQHLMKTNEPGERIYGLNNTAKKLNAWVNQIRTCRGKDIISGQDYNNFLNNLSNICRDILPPLIPILNKIKQSFIDSGFTTTHNSLSNSFAAAKWCAQMKLWQSATTILQEAIVTGVSAKVGLDYYSIEQRQLVDSAFYFNRNKENREVKKQEDIEFINRILSLDLLANIDFVDNYNKLKDLRNDFNHSGMRKTCQNQQKIINSIQKLTNISADIFDIKDNQFSQKNKSILINLSNHPSALWQDNQLTAAEEYREIVDMSFPQISPDASNDDIEQLAQDFYDRILEMKQTSDIVVHIMGEMTFTYSLVNKLKRIGVVCVASTTERISVDNPDGTKTSTFKFVKFRKY